MGHGASLERLAGVAPRVPASGVVATEQASMGILMPGLLAWASCVVACPRFGWVYAGTGCPRRDATSAAALGAHHREVGDLR